MIAPALQTCRARDLLALAEAELAAVSETPRLDAELLLAECAGITRAAVIACPERVLDADQTARLEAAVARRQAGEPLAYILGRKEFYSLMLAVTPDVLVPRPETELLVEAALGRIAAGRCRVLDLGTGSGAIALALKHERPDLAIVAVDASAAALDLARANAATLGLEIDFRLSDWFSSLSGESFDLIVGNPPYVPTEDPHFERGLAHEPRAALDGGADGLDACRAILGDAGRFLARGGQLILEHGHDQRAALVALAAAHGFELAAAIDDLAGTPRVACFRRSNA